MGWVNKLREKIKEGKRSVKEWSSKQWIKLKNWWKENWKTVAAVVGAIAVMVIIVITIHFLLPYATSTITKTDSSLLTNSSEVVKNIPATIKENFNPPAIISNSSNLSIKIPDLSHILRALEIRDTASELTNLISNISTHKNTTSTITSENKEIITKEKVDIPKNPVRTQTEPNVVIREEIKVRKINPPKSESPIWKSFKHYRGKIKTNGLSGKKLRYFEWDDTHNEIEMYDRFGKPIDALDPVTGNRLFKDVRNHKPIDV